MNCTTNKNTLTFSNRTDIDFEYTIKATVEIGDVVVVLLDIPSKDYYNNNNNNNNVFGFKVTGDFLWQIKEVELYYSEKWCAYVGITINAKQELVLFNWCNTAVIVDPQTGIVLRNYQTK